MDIIRNAKHLFGARPTIAHAAFELWTLELVRENNGTRSGKWSQKVVYEIGNIMEAVGRFHGNAWLFVISVIIVRIVA